jgi:hypothetical protein
MDNINSQYVDENGEIKMCNTCRRVKATKDETTWILDTILYVDPPENVIYQTCDNCLNK